MHEKETFGDWLKAERRRSRCTQVDIARILGVSSRSVSQWERGKQTPSAIAREWIQGNLPSRLSANGRGSPPIRVSGRRNRRNAVKLRFARGAGGAPKTEDEPSTAFNAPDLGEIKTDLKFGI